MTSPSELIVPHLIAGLVIRFVMLWYGIYQDTHEVVSYTDIDYKVYTDAARYVINGSSPYLRETYRYTPILAWILTPNLTINPSYGKIVFILFDLLTAYLIYLILKSEHNGKASIGVKWSLFWIYNPWPIIICTRGSSEAIILSLVLAVLYFFQQRAYLIAGILYGFAVHFKPYTLPFCLPLYLASRQQQQQQNESLICSLFKINPTRIKIVIGSIIGFIIPTILCYYYYGYQFLYETYIYHVTRKDIRHNFSLYFYCLYLNVDNDGILLKILSFLPQIILLVGTALLFPSRYDLPFTIFIQTCCFVIFNKVCTSQYFLWYLSILPIIAPKIHMKWTHAVVLICVWFFAQISWLLPAYYLEFEGRNTFIYIWLESIAFFCGNVGILVQLIKNYKTFPFPVQFISRSSRGATNTASAASTAATPSTSTSSDGTRRS